MKLIDAPVGMFEYNGTLALKTEYSTEVNGIGTPDCYTVDSGEFFWGGTYYADERNNLEVEPVEVEVVRHGKWIDRGWDGDFSWQIGGRGSCWRVYECSECQCRTKRETDYCPSCNARMDKEAADAN